MLAAYEELAADGLAVSRKGSGTRVCDTPVRPLPDPRTILRQAQYPVEATPLGDPDGNPLYIHV